MMERLFSSRQIIIPPPKKNTTDMYSNIFLEFVDTYADAFKRAFSQLRNEQDYLTLGKIVAKEFVGQDSEVYAKHEAVYMEIMSELMNDFSLTDDERQVKIQTEFPVSISNFVRGIAIHISQDIMHNNTRFTLWVKVKGLHMEKSFMVSNSYLRQKI